MSHRNSINFKKLISIQLVCLCLFFNLFAEDKAITQIKDTQSRVLSHTPNNVRLGFGAKPKDVKRVMSYTLIKGPAHGKVKMPKPHKKYTYTSGRNATYTSDKDYVGKDSIQWQLNDSVGNSKIATVEITVRATVPIPQKFPTSFIIEKQKAIIPVTYHGGGGFKYEIKILQPKHGKVTIEKDEFHYTPEEGFEGADSFVWYIDYVQDNRPKTTGRITCWILTKKKGQNDWAQWLSDEWRSGFTTMELPDELSMQWEKSFPVMLSPLLAKGKNVYPDIDYCRPVQLGKTIYVPVSAHDSLNAYHTDTGKLLWKFYASGAVRRPAAAFTLKNNKPAVILSSDDGWVYCLNGLDGKVLWKFRGAPNNRKAMGFGRLSSAWPILASAVVSDNKVYFTAGYLPSFGLFAYCLNATTGKLIWENDGRISDMWNTSAFSPLALSYDLLKVYGAVEGASRPWVISSKEGEFLGHVDLGFKFPGSQKHKDSKRDGSVGWFVDGSGKHNIPERVTIKVGEKMISPEFVKNLGIKGEVTNILAGDQKVFVLTNLGKLYCFGKGKKEVVSAKVEKVKLTQVNDEWSELGKKILHREDLKQGLALVLGLDQGRLVEELVKNSALTIVAVDKDYQKLFALRSKLEKAGYQSKRISILHGDPLEFLFSPFISTLIVSEINLFDKGDASIEIIEGLSKCSNPQGGELWLPFSKESFGKIENPLKSSLKMLLTDINLLDIPIKNIPTVLRINRKGLPAIEAELKPPFGMVAFGSEKSGATWQELYTKFNGKDNYSWLKKSKIWKGYKPVVIKRGSRNGYPTIQSVKTKGSIFSSMKNPLYGTTEKFIGIPGSGSDGACSTRNCRYGDYGLTHGKIASVFDASDKYWGRLIYPEAGGCPGRTAAGNGLFVFSMSRVPGITCGCSAAMMFSNFSIAPMAYEETWVNYQRERSSQIIEERPIRKVGINFGAPGDRYVAEEEMLWTHHPYSGRYGANSYNANAMPEALPLIQVSYKGKATSVYHHSASMSRTPKRYRGWVAASYVKGMSEISIPLIQPVIATKINQKPKIDGLLDEKIWDEKNCLNMVVRKTYTDSIRSFGLPKINENCFAMVRYDDENIYFGAGLNVPFYDRYNRDNSKYVSIVLNNRDQSIDDIVITAKLQKRTHWSGRVEKNKKISVGISPEAWEFECVKGKKPFTAELKVPWIALEKAGLVRDQMIINIDIAKSRLVKNFAPIHFDKVKSVYSQPRAHTVKLYFAEMEGKKPGERVFDISLQGKNIVSGLDIVKKAGAVKKELMLEFKGIMISDNLKIGFKKIKGDTLLSGVEIVGEYQLESNTKNKLPSAEIVADVVSGSAPLKVRFNAGKSKDNDGQIVEYLWSFADGRLAKGMSVEHTFAEAGEYEVQLLVRDNAGAKHKKMLKVSVSKGKPSAFICTLQTKGGDFQELQKFDETMACDLTSSMYSFKIDPKSKIKFLPKFFGSTVRFKNKVTGVLERMAEGKIFVSHLSGKPEKGKVMILNDQIFSIPDKLPVIRLTGYNKVFMFNILDDGEFLGRTLIFQLSKKGTYEFSDVNKPVTFTGGGKGLLKFINNSKWALITQCTGKISTGLITCASGHQFESVDEGNQISSLILEGSKNNGTAFNKGVSVKPGRWVTDPRHSLTIRAGKSGSHNRKMKLGDGKYTGFALGGALDFKNIDYLRIENVIIDGGKAVSFGKGASLNNVLANVLRLGENSVVVNSHSQKFLSYNTRNFINRSISYYSMKVRDGGGRKKSLTDLMKTFDTNINYFNCTGKTFDACNQKNIKYINCVVVPGGDGFVSKDYSQPSLALHCISSDKSAKAWDSGLSYENNISMVKDSQQKDLKLEFFALPKR